MSIDNFEAALKNSLLHEFNQFGVTGLYVNAEWWEFHLPYTLYAEIMLLVYRDPTAPHYRIVNISTFDKFLIKNNIKVYMTKMNGWVLLCLDM